MKGLVISDRDRKMLFVGVTTIGSLLALAKGMPAWREWDAARHVESVQLAHDLRAAQRSVETLRGMRDAAARRRHTVDSLYHSLVAARTAPEAGALLASTLADVAEAVGVRVFTLGIRPDSLVKNGFARVAVRLSAVGDVDGITSYLRHIEGDSLLLAVRDLTISQPDPVGADNKAETLRFELLVEALARIDTMPAPKEKTP